jgi:hypothetical protein
VAIVTPWHLWLHRTTGLWLPEGFSAHLMLGAYGDDAPANREAFHELERAARERGGYLAEAWRRIRDEPLGWIRTRAAAVAASALQPHGTSDLGGPSVKSALGQWAASDRTVRGLVAIAGTSEFLVRALVYLFHYAALGLAIVGVWRVWRRPAWLPVFATIACLTTVYGLLTATPRYMFSLEPLLWVLASAGLDRVARAPRPETAAHG